MTWRVSFSNTRSCSALMILCMTHLGADASQRQRDSAGCPKNDRSTESFALICWRSTATAWETWPSVQVPDGHARPDGRLVFFPFESYSKALFLQVENIEPVIHHAIPR